METHHSVSEWLSSLKRGSSEAAQRIWERYQSELVVRAVRRLKTPGLAASSESVVQEAFANFYQAVEHNRFSRLDDRDDLWQVLLMLVARRAIDKIRRANARVNTVDVRGNENSTEAFGINELAVDREPSPETVEAVVQLLASRWPKIAADGELSQIATLKFQGYGNRDIAEKMGIGVRNVERKNAIIRKILEEDD